MIDDDGSEARIALEEVDGDIWHAWLPAVSRGSDTAIGSAGLRPGARAALQLADVAPRGQARAAFFEPVASGTGPTQRNAAALEGSALSFEGAIADAERPSKVLLVDELGALPGGL